MINVKITKYEKPKDLGCYFRAEKVKSRRGEIGKSLETYLLSKEQNEKISYSDMLRKFLSCCYKTNKFSVKSIVFDIHKPENVIFSVILGK